MEIAVFGRNSRVKRLSRRSFKQPDSPNISIANFAPIPELFVSYDGSQKLKVEAADLVSLDLTPRQVCDMELLMNGGFNPLKGFLSEAD